MGKINKQEERVACVLKTAKCTQHIKVDSAHSSRNKSYSKHANVLNTICMIPLLNSQAFSKNLMSNRVRMLNAKKTNVKRPFKELWITSSLIVSRGIGLTAKVSTCSCLYLKYLKHYHAGGFLVTLF